MSPEERARYLENYDVGTFCLSWFHTWAEFCGIVDSVWGFVLELKFWTILDFVISIRKGILYFSGNSTEIHISVDNLPVLFYVQS